MEGYWTSQHPLAALLAQGRSLFIETGAGSAAKHHPAEAQLVAQIVQAIQAADPGLSIGVLSPWRAQNRQILLELERLGIATGDADTTPKVDTVERFQGAERDVIILSTALAEARFLAAMQSVIVRDGLPAPYHDVDRKMVVAASRARQQLIILGHAPFLAPNAHYGPLLEVIRRRGGFITRQVLEQALAKGIETS
jgi:superfamily I DNA and/or RNA helicase